jgi:hypothetical protein
MFLAHFATFSTFLILHMLRSHRLTQRMTSALKIQHKWMNSRKHMPNLHTEKQMWKCMLHRSMNISEQWMAMNNTFHWGREEALVNCIQISLFAAVDNMWSQKGLHLCETSNCKKLT